MGGVNPRPGGPSIEKQVEKARRTEPGSSTLMASGPLHMPAYLNFCPNFLLMGSYLEAQKDTNPFLPKLLWSVLYHSTETKLRYPGWPCFTPAKLQNMSSFCYVSACQLQTYKISRQISLPPLDSSVI